MGADLKCSKQVYKADRYTFSAILHNIGLYHDPCAPHARSDQTERCNEPARLLALLRGNELEAGFRDVLQLLGREFRIDGY